MNKNNKARQPECGQGKTTRVWEQQFGYFNYESVSVIEAESGLYFSEKGRKHINFSAWNVQKGFALKGAKSNTQFPCFAAAARWLSKGLPNADCRQVISIS